MTGIKVNEAGRERAGGRTERQKLDRQTWGKMNNQHRQNTCYNVPEPKREHRTKTEH